jgi:GAF domain-containing protein/HAMP domain-containing protein
MTSPSAHGHQPTVRRSIQTRLLMLLLGLTTISVLTVGILGVNSVQSVGQSARRISAAALRNQAEEYLRRLTVGDAQRNDLDLQRVQHDAENVARYTASIFERSDALADGTYWRAEDHMFTGANGQYMNDETDVSDAFVPEFVEIDDQLLEVLDLSAYLDFILVSTYESNPSTVAIYLGTEEEILRYYPNINIGNVVPPDFQVTQRPWYASAAPENNPEQTAVWSSVYADATGKGLVVTAAAPVYTSQGRFIGVVGIDFTLENLSASVEAARLLDSGYSFLIDDAGQAIALPEQGYRGILGRAPRPDEFGIDLSEVTTEFAPVLAQMMAGSRGFDALEVGGREWFVAYAPLESTGWSLANVVAAEDVLQAVDTLQEELETSTRSLVLARILPVGGTVLAIMVALGLVLARRLAEPIRKIAAAAQHIGAGQWDVPLPRAGKDEIGVLSQAFAAMTAQLRELLEGMEQRVAERTHDLERRSIQLGTAAQVAREAAAIRDVDQFLNHIVHLISERFGYYHAGIFLVDEAGRYALLQAASSEGGKRMLARRHKLEVGEVGTVGYVAGFGEARIALDVAEDTAFFDNPDLPHTRSEIALPLKVGDQVIGVLDVQSKEAAAFSDDDVGSLQTLADQVALAIENARLLEEGRERLRESNALLDQYGWQGWERLAAERPNWGYTYDGVKVVPQEKVHVAGDDYQLRVPLRMRGEITGHVNVALARRSPTPEEEAIVQAVVDQASLALENARLYQETQRRAVHERLVSEITDKMRRAADIDTLMQTTIQEMAAALDAPNAFVQLSALPSSTRRGALSSISRDPLPGEEVENS